MWAYVQLSEWMVYSVVLAQADAMDGFIEVATGPGGALSLAGLWLWMYATGRLLSKGGVDERIKSMQAQHDELVASERARADRAESRAQEAAAEIARLNALWASDVVPALIRFSDAELKRVRGRGVDAS